MICLPKPQLQCTIPHGPRALQNFSLCTMTDVFLEVLVSVVKKQQIKTSNYRERIAIKISFIEWQNKNKPNKPEIREIF